MERFEIVESEETHRKYKLDNNILGQFSNIGDLFSKKVDIREIIYDTIISKSHWIEKLEKAPQVLEYCLKSGLLKELK